MNESGSWTWLGRASDTAGTLSPVILLIVIVVNLEEFSDLSADQWVTVMLTIGVLVVLGIATLVTGVIRRLHPLSHVGPDRGRGATKLMLGGAVLLMFAAGGIGLILNGIF